MSDTNKSINSQATSGDKPNDTHITIDELKAARDIFSADLAHALAQKMAQEAGGDATLEAKIVNLRHELSVLDSEIAAIQRQAVIDHAVSVARSGTESGDASADESHATDKTD